MSSEKAKRFNPTKNQVTFGVSLLVLISAIVGLIAQFFGSGTISKFVIIICVVYLAYYFGSLLKGK